MKKDSSPTITKETITCPACQTPNSLVAAFCRKCGYPLGAVSNLDPMQTIQAEGHLFRKATEGRPTPIVVIGIWICFLPCLVFSVYAALRFILNPRGFSEFFFFWALVALSYAAFVILYRVTKNFLTLPKKSWRDSTTNRNEAGGEEE